MLNEMTFVRESLDSNLFFLRTIREYCVNIELSFYENNREYSDRAEVLRRRCEELGILVVSSTSGVVPPESLEYQLFLTDYTLPVEMLTEKLFGIDLATNITEAELEFVPGVMNEPSKELLATIYRINEQAKQIAEDFIDFAGEIRDKLKTNNLFSYSYLSFYSYMIITADIYRKDLERLDDYIQADPVYTIGNRLQFSIAMYDILLFVRGFIDPSAIKYVNELDMLISQYRPLLEDYNNFSLTPDNQLELTIRNIEIVENMKDLFSRMLTDLLAAKLYFIVDAVTINNFYTDINYFYYTLLTERDYLLEINNVNL